MFVGFLCVCVCVCVCLCVRARVRMTAEPSRLSCGRAGAGTRCCVRAGVERSSGRPIAVKVIFGVRGTVAATA